MGADAEEAGERFTAVVVGPFRGWSGGKAISGATRANALVAGGVEKVVMPGKTSVSVLIGQPSGLQHHDPDYLACNLGTAVFGSGFFSARLLDIIRNKEGLTYGIGASLRADTFSDGSWTIKGTFAPELLEKGLASTRRELRRFYREGITEEELANFKVTLSGAHKVGLATTTGLASALLNALQRGYGPEWLDEYPKRIQALTLSEVNNSLKKRLNPDQMLTVLAGSLQ